MTGKSMDSGRGGDPASSIEKSRTRSRRIYYYGIIVILVSSALSVLFVEKALRLMGHWPFDRWANPPSSQRWSEQNDELGWRPRPGIWESAELGNAPMTFTDTYQRRSFPEGAKTYAQRRIIMVGDSVMMGYGVRDEETFAWHLNHDLPDVLFDNHAVAGYGTYQALKAMRAVFARRGEIPTSLVIYGFFNQHIVRDLVPFDEWILRSESVV